MSAPALWQRLVALAVLSLTPCLRADPEKAQTVTPHRTVLPAKSHFYLFLLIGQSNMAGRGAVEPEDRVPIDRVLTLNAGGEWVPAVDPIHFDKPIAGAGLGRSFAAEVARDLPGVTIGLIPCAVGGSPIDAWRPGIAYLQWHPWDDALRRTRRALDDGILKGVLWHQGESDANSADAPAYAEKLVNLVCRLRVALAAPELPFIAGQMGRFSAKPWDNYHEQVDQATRDLIKRVDHAAYVSADGLRDRGDSLHFDSRSYRELGRRYAAAYRQLEPRR